MDIEPHSILSKEFHNDCSAVAVEKKNTVLKFNTKFDRIPFFFFFYFQANFLNSAFSPTHQSYEEDEDVQCCVNTIVRCCDFFPIEQIHRLLSTDLMRAFVKSVFRFALDGTVVCTYTISLSSLIWRNEGSTRVLFFLRSIQEVLSFFLSIGNYFLIRSNVGF